MILFNINNSSQTVSKKVLKLLTTNAPIIYKPVIDLLWKLIDWCLYMETLVVNGSHSYLIFPRTDNETGVSISILKIKSSWYPKSTMLFNFNE